MPLVLIHQVTNGRYADGLDGSCVRIPGYAYSGAIRPPVPMASGHLFRFDPSGIPVYPATPKFTWFKLLRGDL